MGFKHGIRCRLADPFLIPPRYLYFTQMHPHADMSHSLLDPEFTMSPDPESSLKFRSQLTGPPSLDNSPHPDALCGS
jgi:hypothetical protein